MLQRNGRDAAIDVEVVLAAKVELGDRRCVRDTTAIDDVSLVRVSRAEGRGLQRHSGKGPRTQRC